MGRASVLYTEGCGFETCFRLIQRGDGNKLEAGLLYPQLEPRTASLQQRKALQ